MSVRVEALKACEIDEKWPILKPYIEKALEYSLGEMSAEEVKQDGIDGIYLFLMFYRDKEVLGAATIEIVEHSQKTIASIAHSGGKDVDEWLSKLIDAAVKLAKEQGASELMVCGRKGWTKKLDPLGFKLQYTILSRSI